MAAVTLMDRQGEPSAGGVKWHRPGHTPHKRQSWDMSPGRMSQEGHPWGPEPGNRAGTRLRVALGEFTW